MYFETNPIENSEPQATTHTEEKRICVIGLGNEFISDDGAGIHVVRLVQKQLELSRHGLCGIEIKELSVGGFQLLDHMSGYGKCIIVDAVVSGIHPPGTIYRFIQTPASSPIRLRSSHQVDLPQVIGLATMLGSPIPQTITVFGIEADNVTTFSTRCTEAVERALPELSKMVCLLLSSENDLTISKFIKATPSSAEQIGWNIVSLNVPQPLLMETLCQV
jgi:hydrogenase maturation protease